MSNLFHVSVREHSAFLLMTSLSREYAAGSHLTLQQIAEEMGLSQGYLEEVAAGLKKAGLIQGKQGPGGGYRLSKPPQEISLEDVLTAIGGPVELVDCQKGEGHCPVEGKCSSKSVWNILQKTIRESLRKTTLAETL